MNLSRNVLHYVKCSIQIQNTAPIHINDFMCGTSLCQTLPIGQMMIQIVRFMALLSSPTFNVKSDSAKTMKWTRKLNCDKVDAWTCLFGKPKYHCPGGMYKLPGNKTLIALALLDSIFLESRPFSPYLEQKFLHHKPINYYKKVNVSIHIRGGDSCDIKLNSPVSENAFRVSRIANCSEFGRHTTKEKCFSRTCISPKYYRKLYNNLSKQYSIDRILLATDTEDGINAFRDLNNIIVNSMNREQLNYGNGWIEKRNDINTSDVVVSALSDIRLLSSGHLFIGATCSYFSRLIWNLMVAKNGHDIPYWSVESCAPNLYKQDVSKSLYLQTEKSDILPEQRWRMAHFKYKSQRSNFLRISRMHL